MQEDSKHKTLEQLRQTRIDKIAELRERGINPYPYTFDVSKHVNELIKEFDDLSGSKEIITVAGRMMSNRRMGKVAFAHIQDQTGTAHSRRARAPCA